MRLTPSTASNPAVTSSASMLCASPSSPPPRHQMAKLYRSSPTSYLHHALTPPTASGLRLGVAMGHHHRGGAFTSLTAGSGCGHTSSSSSMARSGSSPPPPPPPPAAAGLPPRPAALKPSANGGPCPFRRSVSKPERPTSDMGERAIAQESQDAANRDHEEDVETARDGKAAVGASTKRDQQQLELLRQFTVAEEDIVVCNRVRRGIAPIWFRHRNSHNHRFQRSLSVASAHGTATHKRLHAARNAAHRRRSASAHALPSIPAPAASTTTKSGGSATRVRAASSAISAHVDKDATCVVVVPQDEARLAVSPLIALPPLNKPVATTAGGSQAMEAEQEPHPPIRLTPREQAMHGRYLIRESFAAGSYGKVCDGEDLPSHQPIAIKIVPKHVLISAEEKQSVVREQAIHRSLNHPQIIKLIDVFEDDGAHYFILERADQGALSAAIGYAGLPEARCRSVFRQVLLALEYLHHHNVVHHDIKPHNILLHADTIKICDFGASRAFNASETSLPFAGVFGTPGYIAPELLLGTKVYGPAIDMFSAGVLLFEMVFGYTPFYPPSACTYQEVEYPAKQQAPAQVKELIDLLLEKDPAKRLTATQALKHPWFAMHLAVAA